MSPAQLYQASPIKRHRSTKAEHRRDRLFDISVKSGSARIITTSPADYLASLADEAAA